VAVDCPCGRTIRRTGRGETLGAEACGADAPHCAGADFGGSHESARGSAGGRRRGVLPDWLAREDLVSGRLVRVLPQWDAREFPVNVIYPGLRKLPARVRAFVDFAVTYMTTEMHAAD
jgi:DNA-binding transcriptional LysR family regulator